jgi:AAA family ATP:ADP antiporter
LKFLINRDFVQTNRWTKATVLYQIGLMKISEFRLDLVAQLFNPDKLIQEVSAWALHQIDPKQYEVDSRRLGEETKKNFDAAVLRGADSRLMSFEKVLFYKAIRIFEGTPGVGLSYLADIF